MSQGYLILSLIGLTVVVGIVIAFVRRGQVYGRDYYGHRTRKKVTFNMYVTHFIGWILYITPITVLFSMIFFRVVPQPVKTVERHDLYIYSAFNSTDTEGHFGLFSGSVEGIEYYYVFYKSNYGYERAKREVYKTSIVETDSRRPEIVKLYTRYDNSGFFKWWDSSQHKYIMYVPKNSVIKEFRIR